MKVKVIRRVILKKNHLLKSQILYLSMMLIHGQIINLEKCKNVHMGFEKRSRMLMLLKERKRRKRRRRQLKN